jgi:hypothetical protein
LYTAGFLFSMRFFWVEKILPRFFRLREIHKKPKNSYFFIFLPPTPTNRVYDRNIPYARIQLILYNNSPQFCSNRRQKFFSKKPWTPTFYRICTSKKCLNGHSSIIKLNMAMNCMYTAGFLFSMRFFWVEKILPRFFRLREIHKKPKNSYFLIFLPPTPTNRVYDRNFPYARIQLILYINSPQFRSNRRQKFFSKNHEPLPKNSYFLIFLPPTPTNRVYDRNIPYARIQLILYNNSPQFCSNRRQKFFSKKPWTPTFYRICTSKKCLNGHSSIIKLNMAMNCTPLDSSFQCASFESKKFYLVFFV